MTLNTLACTALVMLPSVLCAQNNEDCADAFFMPLVSLAQCQAEPTMYESNGSALVTFGVPSCDETSQGIQDLWYAFNSGNNTQVNVYLEPGNISDYSLAVFQGCGGDELACAVLPNGYIAVPTTPNTDHYVQVWSNLDFGSGGTYGLCAMWTTPPPSPPANDDCEGAVVLTPQTVCNYVSGTGYYATMSDLLGTSCGGGTPNDDVWYRFVAPLTPITITVDGDGNASTGYDPVVELAYATGCGNVFNTLVCVDGTGPGGVETIPADFLNPGATYYIRVYDLDSDNPFPSTFQICILRESGMSISDEDAPGDWSLSGDPGTGEFSLMNTTDITGPVVLRVMDLMGRQVATMELVLSPSDTPIDLSALAPGGYLLSIERSGRISSRRFVRY